MKKAGRNRLNSDVGKGQRNAEAFVEAAFDLHSSAVDLRDLTNQDESQTMPQIEAFIDTFQIVRCFLRIWRWASDKPMQRSRRSKIIWLLSVSNFNIIEQPWGL